MALSLLVYSLTALVLAWLGWHANAREQRIVADGGKQLTFWNCWEIAASVLIFAAVAGARYKTGFDHFAYLCQYIELRDMGGSTRTDYEIGFQAISRLFASCRVHEFFYFAFWGGLQLALFYYGLRNRKPLLIWIPIVIMMGGYFINWMNTIRQVVVECAMVAMIPSCTTGKRTLACCAIAILLTTLHITALIVPLFLAIMWLMRNKLMSRTFMFLVLGFCIVAGTYPAWLTGITHHVNLLQGTYMEKYIPLVNDMVDNGFRFTPWGPQHSLIVVSQLLMVWLYRDVYNHFQKDKILHSFFNLAFVGMCLSNLLINTSRFVLRPFEYLSLCQVVVIAYTLKYLWDSRKYVWFTAMAASTLSITCIGVIKAVYIPTDVNLPYLYNFLFWR